MNGPKPGHTYFGVTCHNPKCRSFIGFADIPTGPNTSKVKFEGPGVLATKCGACGLESEYQTSEVHQLAIPPAH